MRHVGTLRTYVSPEWLQFNLIMLNSAADYLDRVAEGDSVESDYDDQLTPPRPCRISGVKIKR
jgi:hypothetical protein